MEINSDNQNKTWVQLMGTDEIIEIENFQYSSFIRGMVEDLGNDPEQPIPLPNNEIDMGGSIENLKKISKILKEFPFSQMTSETFDNLVNGTLLDSGKSIKFEDRFKDKYYSQIPYLKTFEELSSSEVLSFMKLCNFLGVEFLLKYLSELSVVKIKEELKKNN
jgi:hypothetical protein